MQKKYKDFTIEPTTGNWWAIRQNGALIARVYNEEEARRVVWLKSGEDKYITDEMMEVVL